MLNTIKKKLKALFGGGAAREIVVPVKPPRRETSSRATTPKNNPPPDDNAWRREKNRKTHRPKTKPRPENRPTRRPPQAKATAVAMPAPSDATLTPPPEKEGEIRFFDLDIPREILLALRDLNFQYCTPIQRQCLAEALKGQDITGKAQTGTGKTAAFLIAAFARLLRHRDAVVSPGACRVLIMAPTRELAIQIHQDAQAIGKYCGFNNLVIFGGMNHKKQRDSLGERVDLLVGTPGRIIDYCRSGHLKLARTETLIIDEADRMLDMGFIPDVRRIVSQLPPAGKRHTMFFSATLTKEIVRLVDRWLVDPFMVEIEPEKIVTDLIEQKFFVVPAEKKFSLLLWLARHGDGGEDFTRSLVFVNRKDTAAALADNMARNGVECGLLSGDIEQRKRLRILDDFRAGKIAMIVATDVAARGIHVEDVSHVINYDLPEHPEDYIHRIGRTGRAGKKGASIGFLDEYGSYLIPDLEKALGSPIVSSHPPDEALAGDDVRMAPARRGGGFAGKRPGGRGLGGRRPSRGGPPRRGR